MKILFDRFFLICILVLLANPIFAAQSDVQTSIEKRLDRIEQLLNNQNLLQFYTTQQALKQEVSDLRGDFDVLNHDLENVKKQQKELYIDLDQRIQDLQKSVASLKAMPAASDFPSATSASATTPVTAPSANMSSAQPGTGASDAETQNVQNNLSEQESYQAALSALKAGAYNDAIKAFQVFLIPQAAMPQTRNTGWQKLIMC